MSQETIAHVFWQQTRDIASKTAVLYKVDGTWKEVTWAEHGKTVRAACGGLLAEGINPGEKVSILCQSRPHWTWADMAILSAAAVTIPIYPTLAALEVEFLIRHSDSVAIFVENEAQMRKVIDQRKTLPNLRLAIMFDGVPIADSPIKCIGWQDFLKAGEAYLEANPDAIEKRLELVKPTDLASIVYTSGTTGVPKGVMLLHSNIMYVCGAMQQLIKFEPNDVSLSFLPLAHVYERIGGQMVAIAVGLRVAFAESIEAVAKNLQEVRPTYMNGVPRFYEKAYQGIMAQVRMQPKARQYLIRWALSLGARVHKSSESNKSEEAILKQIYRVELRLADRLVFSKIRQRFGGRLRIMVSGAAPLPNQVHEFFETVGLTMVEGYGLTETSAPLSCNTLEDNRFGTVGRTLPGVVVKLAEDGEIMVKGPNIFAGYYKNEEATKQAFHDGWFLTGDIGEVDKEGFLSIKDRKKDLIITAGGKHVAPQYLENLFKGEPLIGNVLVYGDRRKYVTALVTLNKEAAKAFAKASGSSAQTDEELAKDPQIRQEVERVINQKNQPLANFERIKKFEILASDFSIENNELTPTFKVKRKVVTEKYKDKLDGMYEAEDLEAQEGSSFSKTAI